MKHHIDNLKNFGFRGELVVEEPGINAKMNELQSAYGLLQLKTIDENILKRSEIAIRYREKLSKIEGISFLHDISMVKHNYAYYPIFVDSELYGISRDELYQILKDNNIYSRRYFYPLISQFSPYNKLDSANIQNLPVAHKVAEQVICLPIYPELLKSDQNTIIDIIQNQK
jgi:dTDP-4-amino-4,6-dideoxygalactose transaminase